MRFHSVADISGTNVFTQNMINNKYDNDNNNNGNIHWSIWLVYHRISSKYVVINDTFIDHLTHIMCFFSFYCNTLGIYKVGFLRIIIFIVYSISILYLLDLN